MAAKGSAMMPFKNFEGKNPSLYRSGSAPPTVEESLSLGTELNYSGIDSNPDYLSCYYNSIARNPRMPPSIFCKEEWGSRQRLGHDVNHYFDTRLPLSPNNSCRTSTGMTFVDSFNTVAALRKLNPRNDVSDINSQQSSLNPAHLSNSSLLGSPSSSNFATHASNSSRLCSDFTPTGNLPPLLRNSINASSSVASLSYPCYVESLKMFEYANSIGQSSLDTLWMREYASQFYGNNGYNFNLYYPLKPVKHIDGLNGFRYRLRDKFNINKTECDLVLSDIAGYVVYFSMDQLGSRFIQQKLETASVEEINMLFKEVMPQALSLTTDVFGNYVIQKVFEHGSSQQIRELTSKLYSNVLNLSLQIHGCRVIQKAIEVADMDQKVKMAAELDGYIMRCVKDQNGNHVIQKCIEFIPEKAIQFVISFLCGNIITLSTHKYGCLIIQRVLKHCNDPNAHKIMVDEVMKCVCMLVWDQYGNYIVQHAVEHGKPDARSAIIKELTGQLVRMSKHKYASNVVEKCLTFGSLQEREIMVDEMIGNTDDDEPLRVMMKDRFGNYVVQKILETCSDQQLQLVLSRIKAQLSVLKKYVCGKHVARMKKLVAAAERRKAL